jgi:hypothetical protein
MNSNSNHILENIEGHGVAPIRARPLLASLSFFIDFLTYTLSSYLFLYYFNKRDKRDSNKE